MNAIVNFRLCTLSDTELLEKVDTLTDAMYESQKVPTRYIPARPNEDYDLLVGEIIKRFYLMLQDRDAQASVATGDQGRTESQDNTPSPVESTSGSGWMCCNCKHYNIGIRVCELRDDISDPDDLCTFYESDKRIINK